VATVSWTIDQVRRRLVPERGGVGVDRLRPGTLSLVERELPERWAGKRLADLSVPGEVTVVAVTRAGVARLDFDDLVGQDGDVLHVMVTDTALERLNAPQREDRCAPGLRTPEEAPIGSIGGRRRRPAGASAARSRHEGGHRRSRQRGDRHRRRPPRQRPRGPGHRAGPRPGGPHPPDLDITWVVADACEVSSLDAAGLATVDVVVAATGDDEDNLVVSLLAKQEFAVPRVVARVNHPKNQWLFTESWGVDVSVSTPQLLTALVEEAVSVGSLVRLLQFEGGNAHLVEVTLAEDSPANGVSLADLGCPATPRWWPWCGTTT
jgi:Trk K+ transport system NAD-binding subunit